MGIFRRGKTYHYSIVNPLGKLERKSLATADKRVAELKFAKIRESYELQKAGIIPVGPSLEQRAKSLDEIYREFLDLAKLRGRSGAYFIFLDTAWKQLLAATGIKRLDQLTPELMEIFINQRRTNRNTGQTINQKIAILHVLLEWALKKQYISTDPLADWVPLPEDEKRYRRDLSVDEIHRIMAAEEDPELRFRWLVYFTTALRNDAGASLRWEWIDWAERLLVLPIKNNKSKKVNRIPIHPELYEALAARHAQAGRPEQGDVFSKIQKGTVLYKFQRVCRKAGVDMRGVCLHSVRHTVATMIYEASDKNIKAVQEVLGHGNVSTTADYLHVSDSIKRSAVESLNVSFA